MEATISRDRLGSVSTHDLVLSLIPGAIATAVFVAFLGVVSLPVAIAAGSVPASGAIGYALFYAPPVEPVENSGT